MKRITLLFLVGIAVAAPVAHAQQVSVIANPSVGAATVATAELREVFLGSKIQLSDGSPVEPVLGQGGAAHDTFLKDVVGKSEQALRTHFKSLVFTGKGAMPKSFASDGEVVAYVAKTKGAIGYVTAGAETAGVKRIAVR